MRLAKHKQTKDKVAVKRVDRKICPAEQLVKEVDIMRQLRECRGAIQLFDVYEEPGKPFTNLVMELVTGGELFEYIVKSTSYSEKSAADYARQLCETVAVLHSKNIIHRDLKPENLLFEDATAKTLKICDFGLADTLKSDEDQLTWAVGTKCYMAPEVTAGSGYGKPVDMYSIGVIIYVLLCGYLPIDPDNGITELEYPEKEWEEISPEVKTLITKLLSDEPGARPTAPQVLQHPWVRGNNTSNKPLVGTLRNLRTLRATTGRGGGAKIRPNVMDIAFSPPETAASSSTAPNGVSAPSAGTSASATPTKNNRMSTNQAIAAAKNTDKWLVEPRVVTQNSQMTTPPPLEPVYQEAYLNRLNIFREITIWTTALVAEEHRPELSELLPKYQAQLDALTAHLSLKSSHLQELAKRSTICQARLLKLQQITSDTHQISGKTREEWRKELSAHKDALDSDVKCIQAQCESLTRIVDIITRDREDVATKLSANVSREEIDSLLSGARSRYQNESAQNLNLLLNLMATGGSWSSLSPSKTMSKPEDLELAAVELSSFILYIQEQMASSANYLRSLTSSDGQGPDGQARRNLPKIEALQGRLKSADLAKALNATKCHLADVREALLLAPTKQSSCTLGVKLQEFIGQVESRKQAMTELQEIVEATQAKLSAAEATSAHMDAHKATLQQQLDVLSKQATELTAERAASESQIAPSGADGTSSLLAGALRDSVVSSLKSAEAKHVEFVATATELEEQRVELEVKLSAVRRSLRS